jgi:hypothetical protein
VDLEEAVEFANVCLGKLQLFFDANLTKSNLLVMQRTNSQGLKKMPAYPRTIHTIVNPTKRSHGIIGGFFDRVLLCDIDV